MDSSEALKFAMYHLDCELAMMNAGKSLRCGYDQETRDKMRAAEDAIREILTKEGEL